MFDQHKQLALGCMGLSGTWNPAELTPARVKRAIDAFEAALVAGITLYDHADIYGGGTCESVFKDCLAAFPDVRGDIQIWSKGGIRDGFFDHSPAYLRECIERSRVRMGIDALDLFQLHRPDPLAHPRETAKVLHEALAAGHIKAVGVSNYFPEQIRALQKFLDVPLVSHQWELHILRLQPFYEGWHAPAFKGYSGEMNPYGDGTLDFCLANGLTPLAYAPLASGRLTKNDSEDGRERDVQDVLGKLALKYDATRTQIALAWLRTHPANIIPVVGSANPQHIFEAAQKTDLRLEKTDWYDVWKASWERGMP